MNKNTTQKDLEHAKRVLSIEAAGLNKLSQSLNETLTNALNILQLGVYCNVRLSYHQL